MPPSRRSSPRTVALALLLTTVSAAPAVAAGDDAPPPALWRMVADAPAVPRIDGVTWSGAIDLNAGAMAAQPGDDLRLDLPDGPVIVTIERRAVAAPGRFVLAGRPALDAPGGAFLLAVHRTGLAGALRLGAAGTYRIRGHADGSIQLERLDEAAMPWCGRADAPGLDAAAAAAGGAASPGEECDDGSVIDVLLLYTQEARDAAGGTDNILAEIDLMVEYMNTGFVISNVNPRMHIVYSWEITTPQNQISVFNLAGRDDGVIDGIHDLRDLYGGDQVALVVSGGGGVAMGLWTLDPEMEANMFCINGRNTMPFIVAHEVGHNLGCCHARGDGGGCPPEGGLLFPFSNGHRFFGDSGEQWRTIMAYNPGVLSAHYSNPDVLFDGVPTGVPEEESDSADNAQTINLAAFTVSNWRCNDGICEGLELPSDADDCNHNEIPDLCEIAQGLGEDVNGDGILDECQCVGDVDGSGMVDFGDILAILAAWGNMGGPEDLDGSGVVDFGDLLIVLAAWGPCE